MSGNSHETRNINFTQPAIMFVFRICALAAKGIVSQSLFLGSLVFLLPVASTSAFAQNSDPKEALQQKLAQTFTATAVSPNRHYIVTPGSILVLAKDGMMMYSVDSPLPPSNSYKNGKISQGMGGFGRDLIITGLTHGGGTAANYPQRKFGVAEKLWVSQMAVQKDSIAFVLYSEPDANNIRYYGELKFQFAKRSMPSPDDALKTIGDVLTVQPPDNAASAGGQQQPPADQAPAVRPSGDQSFSTIAPPPPPADEPVPPPKTISQGDAKDQVIATFGRPQKVVLLGTKEIDYYPDMKVTFVNGKVTDVQ
jgi:hypothetical protein